MEKKKKQVFVVSHLSSRGSGKDRWTLIISLTYWLKAFFCQPSSISFFCSGVCSLGSTTGLPISPGPLGSCGGRRTPWPLPWSLLLFLSPPELFLESWIKLGSQMRYKHYAIYRPWSIFSFSIDCPWAEAFWEESPERFAGRLALLPEVYCCRWRRRFGLRVRRRRPGGPLSSCSCRGRRRATSVA